MRWYNREVPSQLRNTFLGFIETPALLYNGRNVLHCLSV